ncbi:hypothetical protein Cni_G23355 [Canna indica]|uniref:RING-type E3 ubiquitin transferase n=1 Tax=Canna indica TaxID=4628 RepID=A0AAQ3KTV6_9LILI|nr:hypothetical protein Cni_G23355 [Canna indica]
MPSFFSICFFFFFFFSLAFYAAVGAAQQPDEIFSSPPTSGESFRPSVTIVIGVFSLMFSLTFLLLIYAKFCRSAATSDLFNADAAGHGRFVLPQHRFSGIDKTVVESLPLFQFSSLRGVRDGLECAVCLSKFDDAELLRLLPKCKHAFHLACVDRWFEAHSSCPLCRCRVNAEDAALFKYSTSARFLFSTSDRFETSGRDLELFVEREPSKDGDLRGSSRFSLGGSFRKIDKTANEKSDQDLPILEEGEGQFLHKFKHKIIVSDVVFKSRWSDVNSSDLISLNSEMLSAKTTFADVDWNAEPIGLTRTSGGSSVEGKASVDEKVLKIKEEMEKRRLLEIKASQISKTNPTAISTISSVHTIGVNPISNGSRSLISSGNRSMSEITNLSRFRQARDSTDGAMEGSAEDEKVRRLWLPIAKRTVQWFAGRERRSETEKSRRSRNDEDAGV